MDTKSRVAPFSLDGGNTISSLPPDDAYFTEFGRFISSYAQAEGTLAYVLRWMTGLPDATARIIFGGMRFAELHPRLSSLAIGKPQADEVSAILNQMKIISDVRNELVHRTVAFDASGIGVINNFFTAKDFSKIEQTPITIDDLKSLNQDCTFIFVRLMLVIFPDAIKTETLPPGLSRKDLFGPWRYNRPKQFRNAGEKVRKH